MQTFSCSASCCEAAFHTQGWWLGVCVCVRACSTLCIYAFDSDTLWHVGTVPQLLGVNSDCAVQALTLGCNFTAFTFTAETWSQFIQLVLIIKTGQKSNFFNFDLFQPNLNSLSLLDLIRTGRFQYIGPDKCFMTAGESSSSFEGSIICQ